MDYNSFFSSFAADIISFLLKAIILVFCFAAVVAISVSSKKKNSSEFSMSIINLKEKLLEQALSIKKQILSKDDLKKYKKEQEALEKTKNENPNLYVIDFKGSIDAKEVASLKQEVNAIISSHKKGDEVMVNLESGGGVVHGYGLAAMQLSRIRDAGINLTVCVDKVAASGGYMMACVADNLIAAPFSIIGSIGVIGQLPNFNRLLDKCNVDYEQHTAGNFKRTLTMLGKNSDESRAKFKDDLENIHKLFKGFIAKYRPDLDIAEVSTGECWFGTDALNMKLVDHISTSDDFLLNKLSSHNLYKIEYKANKGIMSKLEAFGFKVADRILEYFKFNIR